MTEATIKTADENVYGFFNLEGEDYAVILKIGYYGFHEVHYFEAVPVEASDIGELYEDLQNGFRVQLKNGCAYTREDVIEATDWIENEEWIEFRMEQYNELYPCDKYEVRRNRLRITVYPLTKTGKRKTKQVKIAELSKEIKLYNRDRECFVFRVNK